MQRSNLSKNFRKTLAAATVLLSATIALTPFQPTSAMITGGEGNRPVHDPGWPAGAALIFNHPGRIAYWEGPPFGGGQYHSECRGDAKTFNAVLADFVELKVKNKRLVVHDGLGNSTWLNINNDPEKRAKAKMDWVFMVWALRGWEQVRKFPPELNPIPADELAKDPPAQIDVYTGGSIHWLDVIVPQGIEVIDERLEAHGFKPADGTVLEGKVVDLATGKPIAARMKLEKVEPQPKGGYRYTKENSVDCDANGRWVLKNTPEGWHRVVIEADGYVPRAVGFLRNEEQLCWHSYDGGLSRPATVSGRVADDADNSISDVEVHLGDIISSDGRRYESSQEYKTQTDADGRFQFEGAPLGKTRVSVHKAGYCRPGLSLAVTMPAKDVALTMIKSAQVQVTVDFGKKMFLGEYIVEIRPEGGEVVGSWGGSGKIDNKNQIAFHDVPPGKYILRGYPNPSSANEKTAPVPIDLKGGETKEVTLTAK
jgi:hypothetical protein